MKREQQELLTRVGAGTPMGDLLRRYWFPVAVSAELGRATAQAVRLLGALNRKIRRSTRDEKQDRRFA